MKIPGWLHRLNTALDDAFDSMVLQSRHLASEAWKWTAGIWRTKDRRLVRPGLFLASAVALIIWVVTLFGSSHTPKWLVRSGTYVLLGKVLAGIAILALLVWIRRKAHGRRLAGLKATPAMKKTSDPWYARMFDHSAMGYLGAFVLFIGLWLFTMDRVGLKDVRLITGFTKDLEKISWPRTAVFVLLVVMPLLYLLYKWGPWRGRTFSFGFVPSLMRALLPLTTIAAVVYFVYWYRGYATKVRTENYQAYVRDSVSADAALTQKMKTAQALPYPDSLGDTVRVLIKVDSTWSPVYTRHAGCKLYWMPTDDEESRTARIVIKTPYEVIVDNPGDYVYAQYEVPRAEFKSLTGPTELLLVITVEDPRKCKHPFPVQHESPPNTNRPPLKYASQG